MKTAMAERMSREGFTGNFTPATRAEIVKRLNIGKTFYVYRTYDMARFEVTGVGRNTFVSLNRHGIEHAREFSERWWLETVTREVTLREAREARLNVRMDTLRERVHNYLKNDSMPDEDWTDNLDGGQVDE